MKKKIVKLLESSGIDKKLVVESLEIPKDYKMGDYALPCFGFAKQFRKKPEEIAREIAGKIKKDKEIEKIKVSGGYVNFFFDKKILGDKIIKRI